MNSMQIPAHVEQIIHTLNSHGYEAFAVGGCVRDTLLGRKPGDWDITTSARPEQVKALFRRTIDTGIQHGTVTIMMDRTGYEVTTYRIDGEYEDGRHPKQVEFTSDLLEDLRRRDFTINAMAYSHATGIVDAFDGLKTLSLPHGTMLFYPCRSFRAPGTHGGDIIFFCALCKYKQIFRVGGFSAGGSAGHKMHHVVSSPSGPDKKLRIRSGPDK